VGGSGGSSGGSTSLWSENGTKIHYSTGKVGINTSDPSETLEVVGNIKATNIEAVGTNIKSLSATNITSGTLNNARLPTDIDVTSLKGTGANITSLNATNITSGTLNNARLPADIDVTSFKGTGTNITSLNATNITSGTLNNARLPADISITGGLTAKNLNVTGVTTTINTDTYQTENLEIISTGADGPSLKITHDTASHDILQVTDTTSTQSLTMTHDGKIGIGTATPSAPLHIYDTSSTSDIFKASDTEITINRSIIPETNDTVDIGSAERKIRDMYISNNSLWLGDDHKLAITSDGTMKFRKRNKTTLPKVLRDSAGTDEEAVAHVNQKYGTSFTNVSEFKLNHVLSYAKTINPEYQTSDVFGEDTQDYEQDTAADAWQVNSSKIFLGNDYTNIGIGTDDPDPAFKLDVAGNVNTTGTISTDNITIRGSATGSGSIKLNCEDNTHGVYIKGPLHVASQSYTLTLPSTAPEASKVLSTDASGNLSWIDQASGGSGNEPIKLSVENILNPTTSPSQLSYEISAESDYKTIYFKYDSGNVNASGQTEYTLEFNNSTECDILLVGGGGGGGVDNSGGGGAGGLVLLENIQLYNGITIKVGGGGAGAPTSQSTAGLDGKDSAIEFSETYIARGGGGGGTGNTSSGVHSGGNGGSGGGAAKENYTGTPGTSDQDQYIFNGLRRGWGFAGGNGVDSAGGGGGGASEIGIDGDVVGNKLGGHGGDGKYEVNGTDFKTIFNITDTTIGDHIDGKVYFAGGGGGGNDNNLNSTNLPDGSGYSNRGGFGGGGAGGYNTNNKSNPGIANTGGGGGGCTHFGLIDGGAGGSGIVILRYRYRKSLNIPSHYYIEKSGPQITSGPVAQVTDSYVTGSDLYKYMMFTYDAANDNGSGQTEYALNLSQNTDVDILIVAGGGGGGKSGGAGAGGGGGAGGVIYLQNQTISSGSYTIKVGKGGNIQTIQNDSGYSGHNSSFNDNIAIGGGGGGGHSSGTNSGNGYNGGSGGGGGTISSGASGTGGTGTTNQGNNGGVGSSSNANSPGGGGSGSVGNNGTSTSGGGGGTGTLINITGAHIAYAGGGGGGSEASNNPGSGMAGGGNGGGTDSDGSNALDNTGSGGGGSGGAGIGGAGGSGVVIIRYLAKSLGQDIDTTLATKTGTGLEWDITTKKFNVATEYGPGTTESYLFLQTSAVFQNDDVDLY
jgi:hypothetical protein